MFLQLIPVCFIYLLQESFLPLYCPHQYSKPHNSFSFSSYIQDETPSAQHSSSWHMTMPHQSFVQSYQSEISQYFVKKYNFLKSGFTDGQIQFMCWFCPIMQVIVKLDVLSLSLWKLLVQSGFCGRYRAFTKPGTAVPGFYTSTCVTTLEG